MLIAVSVFDLECDIFLASGLRAMEGPVEVMGSITVSCGAPFVLRVSASALAGECSLLRLIDRTACCSSPHAVSNSCDLGCRTSLSSPSEFSDESGGDRIAPVGINKLFKGGGDWRRLPFAAIAASFDLVVSCLSPSSEGCVADGLRLCLLRYAVEDTDRGRFGRGEIAPLLL